MTAMISTHHLVSSRNERAVNGQSYDAAPPLPVRGPSRRVLFAPSFLMSCIAPYSPPADALVSLAMVSCRNRGVDDGGSMGNSDLARFKKVLVRQIGEEKPPASSPALAVTAEHGPSPASSPPHDEGGSAVAAAPTAAATATMATTGAATAGIMAGGAPVETSAGGTHAADGVPRVDLEGEGEASHAPGRRRSRWRRRFRRLLRRGDREQEATLTATMPLGADSDGSRAG